MFFIYNYGWDCAHGITGGRDIGEMSARRPMEPSGKAARRADAVNGSPRTPRTEPSRPARPFRPGRVEKIINL